MKVKEYLNKLGDTYDITFIEAKALKSDTSPGYEVLYKTWPINRVYDLKDSKVNDYIILNDRQCPIDWLSGAEWSKRFKKYWLECLLIISEDDFAKLYPNIEQKEHIETYIEEKIKGRHI